MLFHLTTSTWPLYLGKPHSLHERTKKSHVNGSTDRQISPAKLYRRSANRNTQVGMYFERPEVFNTPVVAYPQVVLHS